MLGRRPTSHCVNWDRAPRSHEVLCKRLQVPSILHYSSDSCDQTFFSFLLGKEERGWMKKRNVLKGLAAPNVPSLEFCTALSQSLVAELQGIFFSPGGKSGKVSKNTESKDHTHASLAQRPTLTLSSWLLSFSSILWFPKPVDEGGW